MLLSVCLITYNHEKYIREALDSVLMQKNDFYFEIVIGDDSSTDSTPEICREYATKYPNIRYERYEPNGGLTSNWVKTIKRCRGKYIALLEGDDYWTANNKLQKQVDFLDKNPQYSFCYHGFDLKIEEGGREYHNFRNKLNAEKKEINFEDSLQTCYPQTLTVVFRNNIFNIDNLMGLKVCDRFLFQTMLIDSKAYYLDEQMGSYRIHSNQYTNNAANDSYATLDNILGGEKLLKMNVNTEQIKLINAHLAKHYSNYYSRYSYTVFNRSLYNSIYYYLKTCMSREKKRVKNNITLAAITSNIFKKIFNR